MAKRCALSTGNLLRGGLPRNSMDRITDRPDMTSAVYRGRKASTQTNKTFVYMCINNVTDTNEHVNEIQNGIQKEDLGLM